ncbi:hypothetical protein CEY04_20545 [Achromobacter sp. HZ28]|nr:hypothetical protein CEY04_20545 [Achromobacter sp. HZ28]OWT76566.1 hypothetical protein CEY05_16000 [Achromobacter sp. HZ34]
MASFFSCYAPVWVALLFTAALLVVCYPGFMSYDSLRMLEEARTQVQGGIYPAMPVYLMRLADLGGHGPTVMLTVQNFMVFFCLALILRFVSAPQWLSVPILAIFLLQPVLVGVMLVVWKDVTTTAPMLLALVLIYWASQNPTSPRISLVKWSALLMLVIATLVRFNALTATAVIVGYWVLTFYSGRGRSKQLFVFVLALLAMAASNVFVNGYAFPDLRKLDENELAYGIMSYDLVGISKWSGESMVPVDVSGQPAVPKADIADIDRIYNSLGALHISAANESLGNPVELTPPGYSNSDVARAWINAIIHHPVAYARYRFDLFEEIIGAKPHPIFEPTHFARIDPNELGVVAHDRAITRKVLEYIETASTMIYGKPWPYLLLSMVCCVVMVCLRTIPGSLKILGTVATGAAFMYIAPFLVMTGTGEVRYVYPTLILGSIPVLILLFGWRLARPMAAEQVL